MHSDDDRGAVLFILMLFLVIFIGVATLAVDLAAKESRAQDLQNTSDAAALAGIVEYQDQILSGATETEAETAADGVVRDIMRQNGIDPDDGDIQITIELSDDRSQLTVNITDGDPDQFLPADFLGETIKDGDQGLTRGATAEYLACEEECSLVVQIEKAFGFVPARGDGDGYKPILVNDKLFAINHNSGARNIVCISTITLEPCWESGPFRSAYNGNYFDRNPEMPHTAVVQNRIYWTATSETTGLRLYCFNAAAGVDVPCTNSITLNSSLTRFDEGDADNTLTNDKDENRGGGTFTVFGDKVFAFSDDHRIHCYDPVFNGTCTGYSNGGNETALGASGFPASSPAQGNHGSSIDRIVDKATGYVYSTLHIPFAQDFDCTSPLADPAGKRVVVVNKGTDRYLSSAFFDDVSTLPDGADNRTWWDVRNYGADTVSFQSVRHGEYLDANFFVGTSSNLGEDDRWDLQISAANDSYYIDSAYPGAGALLDDAGNVIESPDSPPVDLEAEWNFYDWQCGIDPDAVSTAPDYFESGTWLHCYDTGTVSNSPGACPGFQVTGVGADAPGEPSPLHLDGTRFSGRLWFYYAASPGADIEPTKLGVCSSGYGQWHEPGEDLDQDSLEVTCVDMNGSFDSSLSNRFDSFVDIIADYTRDRPGAWGDPEWNPSQNRLFYPSEHGRWQSNVDARILCFDFDDGAMCGDFTGEVPPNATGITKTEDYGFVMEGDCVFALGHTAFFWAFKASDTSEPCDARIPPARIERCGCGDGLTFRWGELDFREVDLDLFDVFGIRIVTDDGGDGTNSLPIFPVDGSFWSLKPGGESPRIALDDLAIPEGAESVLIEFDVEGLDETLIEEVGDFEIRFAQRPKLVD